MIPVVDLESCDTQHALMDAIMATQSLSLYVRAAHDIATTEDEGEAATKIVLLIEALTSGGPKEAKKIEKRSLEVIKNLVGLLDLVHLLNFIKDQGDLLEDLKRAAEEEQS